MRIEKHVEAAKPRLQEGLFEKNPMSSQTDEKLIKGKAGIANLNPEPIIHLPGSANVPMIKEELTTNVLDMAVWTQCSILRFQNPSFCRWIANCQRLLNIITILN